MDNNTLEKTTQVIDIPRNDDDELSIDEKMRETIRELANEYRASRIYERAYTNRRQGIEAIWYKAAPKDIHTEMLEKIANAPFAILVQTVPMAMIPILDDRLDGKTEMTPPVKKEKK